MAAARDQAARIRRPEPDPSEGEAAREASAALAQSLRAHLSEDEGARHPAEVPTGPVTDAPTAPATAAAPKTGRRRHMPAA